MAKQNNVGTTGGLIAQVVSDVLAGCPKAIVWGLNADHARRLLFEVYRRLQQQTAEPYSVWMRRDDVIDYCGSEVHAVSEYTSWVQEKLRGASVYVDHAVMEAWERPIYVRSTEVQQAVRVAEEVSRQLGWGTMLGGGCHPTTRTVVVVPYTESNTVRCTDPDRTITVMSSEWEADAMIEIHHKFKTLQCSTIDTIAGAVHNVLTDWFNPYYLEMQ